MDFAKNFIKRTIPYLNEEQLMPVYEATSKNSPHVMSEMCLAMSVNDYRDVLENIAVPPFITYGEKSTLYSSKTAEYLSWKIPNSKFIPFENCTHFLLVEDLKKLVEVVKEALSI